MKIGAVRFDKSVHLTFDVSSQNILAQFSTFRWVQLGSGRWYGQGQTFPEDIM